jgi:hypothetical protein
MATKDECWWMHCVSSILTQHRDWLASPGGYFFGTVPDGKRVLAALNRRTTLECPMLTLAAQTFCEEGPCNKTRAGRTNKCAAHGQPPPAVFGSAYTCAIGDTVTAGRICSSQMRRSRAARLRLPEAKTHLPHFVCREHDAICVPKHGNKMHAVQARARARAHSSTLCTRMY